MLPSCESVDYTCTQCSFSECLFSYIQLNQIYTECNITIPGRPAPRGPRQVDPDDIADDIKIPMSIEIAVQELVQAVGGPFDYKGKIQR